jgi:hypothetical protein
MSPLARALDRESRQREARVRKESRLRDRQFAPRKPSPLLELVARYWWVAVAAWLAFGWWWFE